MSTFHTTDSLLGLAISAHRFYHYAMKVEESAAVYPARVPASPELAARAAELVRQFAECFWFRRTDAKIQTADDVKVVIEHLREYGNKQAWEAAKELRRCL